MTSDFKVTLLDQFQTTGERITETYVKKVESYVETQEFEQSLKKYLDLENQLILKPLSGGITSVVYKTQGLKNDAVLKFSTRYNIFNDYYGLKVAHKYGIPVPKPIYIQEVNENFWFSITEYIDAPLLSVYLTSTLSDLTPVTQFGKVIRKLNSIEGIGYGEIDENSFCGKLRENEDIRKWFVTQNNEEYLVKHDIFSEELVKKITNKLTQYVYKEQGCLIHRDVRNENCLWNGNPIIFDFNARYGDPLYDLANYRQKVLSRGKDSMWDAFFDGYGIDIDVERLDLITGNILFNKAVDWHKRNLDSRHKWAVNFLTEKFI